MWFNTSTYPPPKLWKDKPSTWPWWFVYNSTQQWSWLRTLWRSQTKSKNQVAVGKTKQTICSIKTMKTLATPIMIKISVAPPCTWTIILEFVNSSVGLVKVHFSFNCPQNTVRVVAAEPRTPWVDGTPGRILLLHQGTSNLIFPMGAKSNSWLCFYSWKSTGIERSIVSKELWTKHPTWTCNSPNTRACLEQHRFQ